MVIEFQEAFPSSDLERERQDQERRDAAMASEAGVEIYLAHVDEWLRRHQAAGRFNWAPGYQRGSEAACSEFRGRTLVRLLELIRGPGFKAYEKTPGVEATFVIVAKLRTWIRRQRLITEVFHPEELKVTSTPEDLMAEREEQRILKTAGPLLPRAARRLKQERTRFWLKAMLDDVVRYGELDPARVASAVGKDRSSAWRAMQAIKHAVEAERRALGLEL